MPLTLVADRDIPHLEECFSSVFTIRRLPAAQLRRQELRGADAVLVRSHTRVGEKLLDGTSVRLVISATTGTDHLELDYLCSAGISWVSGAGGNARAVVEYVLAAIGLWLQAKDCHLQQVRIGLIGCGRIGGMLRALLRQCGAEVLACDPFRSDCDASLAQVLDCDIVSVHTPLIQAGRWPTRQLLSSPELRQLARPGCLLINTARGSVISADALMELADASSDAVAPELVLDVWPDEKAVPQRLVRRCSLASAHLAGHTLQGRRQSVRLAAKAAAQMLGAAANRVGPEPSPEVLSVQQTRTAMRQLERYGLPTDLLAATVPLRRMYADLMALPAQSGVIKDAAFAGLRNGPPRSDLSQLAVPKLILSAENARQMRSLGLAVI